MLFPLKKILTKFLVDRQKLSKKLSNLTMKLAPKIPVKG